MAFYDPILEKLALMRHLTPSGLRKLADVRLSDLVVKEATRAKKKIDSLNQRYPTAGNRELAQRLVDSKKGFASMVGGVSGVFGVISVPADLLAMVYLQLTLLVEISTLYKVNLKSERARQELIDVFGYANGVGPLQRSSPKLVGSLAAVLLTRGGLSSLGRAMPLVSAPISAYLNNQHIQAVGEEAVRHYDGFLLAAEKTPESLGAVSSTEVDAQTGAYTRQYFERLVDEAVRAAKKSGAPLTLLWVDADELTEANDAHGREAVDLALAALAQGLSTLLDGKGPIGRVKGGAFAALLPGLGADAAMVVAEQVRAAQSARTAGMRLRVCCGVAALAQHEPFGNLLDAAESACTRAKQSGRDAVARR